MNKLAIIHTTASTIEPLRSLVDEIIPSCEVVNFVDDSILPQLLDNDGDLGLVRERLISYAQFAQDVGADVVLEACSSVGEVVDDMASKVDIPIVRIDEAMSEKAVRKASHIGVAATLPTTLAPTRRLLEKKGQDLSESLNIEPLLIKDAFNLLLQGDLEAHDTLLVEGLTLLAEKVEIVILAQASMARVISRLPENLHEKFLTSPRLAVEKARTLLESIKQEKE
jgi:Asp/Glu/hydantoin racemase